MPAPAPSPPTTAEALNARQFGAVAANYVESRVHAAGADLAQMVGIAQRLAGARVVDLGCGGGHVSYAVAPHVGEVTAYDLSPEMLAAVEPAGVFVCGTMG